MKKLLTLCLIMATTLSISAQDGKPTKEETVAYLARSFELVTGNDIPQGGENEDMIISKYDFSFNKITEVWIDGSVSGRSYYVKWETLDSISPLECPDSEIYKICNIDIWFSSKSMLEVDGEKYPCDFLRVYVLKSRVESVRKAFLRLSEIAKEENKDPFQD